MEILLEWKCQYNKNVTKMEITLKLTSQKIKILLKWKCHSDRNVT